MKRIQFQSVKATQPEFEVIQGAYAWCCAISASQLINIQGGNATLQCEPSWPFEDERSISISLGPCFLSDFLTIVDVKAEKWGRFQNLVKQWRDERGARSSITDSAMLPAYQKIIGMGHSAVPLILGQLKSEGDQPDQWFWALMAITGQNPVKSEDQGNFREMARAWIQWGEENADAYIW
jgi:hypothetical protein